MNLKSMLWQGSPTLRAWTSTHLWPVRKQAAQEEVSSEQASEASSVFTATPQHLHDHLSSASCQISGGSRFLQEYEACYELHM